MNPKYKVGQTKFYMFLNKICVCKIKSIRIENDKVYYSDGHNHNILEKYLFSKREDLWDFQSRVKK